MMCPSIGGEVAKVTSRGSSFCIIELTNLHNVKGGNIWFNSMW